MNPNVGSFTQPDPMGIAGGLDLYGYVGGDPVNNADPSGLDPTYHLGGLTVSVSRCDDNFRWTCGTGGPPGTGPVVGPVGFPNAGNAGSGVSSGGGSGGHDETRSPTCAAAIGGAAISWIADIALIGGVGLGARAFSTAFSLGTRELALGMKGAIIDAAGRDLVLPLTLNGAGMGLGAFGAGIGATTWVEGKTLLGDSGWDWVPIVGSTRRTWEVHKACPYI